MYTYKLVLSNGQLGRTNSFEIANLLRLTGFVQTIQLMPDPPCKVNKTYDEDDTVFVFEGQQISYLIYHGELNDAIIKFQEFYPSNNDNRYDMVVITPVKKGNCLI